MSLKKPTTTRSGRTIKRPDKYAPSEMPEDDYSDENSAQDTADEEDCTSEEDGSYESSFIDDEDEPMEKDTENEEEEEEEEGEEDEMDDDDTDSDEEDDSDYEEEEDEEESPYDASDDEDDYNPREDAQMEATYDPDPPSTVLHVVISVRDIIGVQPERRIGGHLGGIADVQLHTASTYPTRALHPVSSVCFLSNIRRSLFHDPAHRFQFHIP
eukprot:jgi/Mesvir1/9623/Mv05585-RA.1